ncbi:Alpha/Beta hydrolase protein [Ilyonectria destructans]|nr:Alpha/Beta hydrolase protein [Ilyonectria destructans]
MMDSFPPTGIDGYVSKTFIFKSTKDGDIHVDVAYPEVTDGTGTVLIHYHGGFLVVGDRYSFFPYWLLHACTSRKWIFVIPDYRLLPETTAHSSLQDAVDAYSWVLQSLPQLLGRTINSVMLAGSSAGAYLALATAATVDRQPSALLLIYGMLDATFHRYTTPGTNIFNRPMIETSPILGSWPKWGAGDDRQVLSAYPLPENPTGDPRLALVAALHIDGLFPDYMTGTTGIGRMIAEEGIGAIPQHHKSLFPLAFGNLEKLPRTMLLHGKNDSAVPVELSVQAMDKLRAAGVNVCAEFPENAEHGFDARAGNVNIETSSGEDVVAFQSLRNAVNFLAR